MVVYAFNPRGQRQDDLSDFKDSLVYTDISRTTGAKYRDSVSKNKTKKWLMQISLYIFQLQFKNLNHTNISSDFSYSYKQENICVYV